MSTSLALLSRPAPEEDRRELHENTLFPEDVVLWAFFVINLHRPRAQKPNPKRQRSKQGCTPLDREVWTDIVLKGGPDEPGVSSAETRAIHVYAVCADGFVVTHQTRQHKPAEIFKIYPRGNAVLRLFSNARESVGQDWPLDCHGVAKLRGTVIIVAIDVTGKRTRHVFRIPSNVNEPWKVHRKAH